MLCALFTDASEKVVGMVEKRWEEISRVLRVGGRYLCVSLLQPHIMSSMVTWFSSRG